MESYHARFFDLQHLRASRERGLELGSLPVPKILGSFLLFVAMTITIFELVYRALQGRETA